MPHWYIIRIIREVKQILDQEVRTMDVFGENRPEVSFNQRRLEYLESEIRDLKNCLAGVRTSRRWEKLDMELKNLQVERRYLLFSIYGFAKYPDDKLQSDGSPPRNLREQIPDL